MGEELSEKYQALLRISVKREFEIAPPWKPFWPIDLVASLRVPSEDIVPCLNQLVEEGYLMKEDTYESYKDKILEENWIFYRRNPERLAV